MIYTDSYLEHYGIKGMHWGIRNDETRAKYANEGKGRPSRKEVKAERNKLLNKMRSDRANLRTKYTLQNPSVKRDIKKFDKIDDGIFEGRLMNTRNGIIDSRTGKIVYDKKHKKSILMPLRCKARFTTPKRLNPKCLKI